MKTRLLLVAALVLSGIAQGSVATVTCAQRIEAHLNHLTPSNLNVSNVTNLVTLRDWTFSNDEEMRPYWGASHVSNACGEMSDPVTQQFCSPGGKNFFSRSFSSWTAIRKTVGVRVFEAKGTGDFTLAVDSGKEVGDGPKSLRIGVLGNGMAVPGIVKTIIPAMSTVRARKETLSVETEEGTLTIEVSIPEMRYQPDGEWVQNSRSPGEATVALDGTLVFQIHFDKWNGFVVFRR